MKILTAQVLSPEQQAAGLYLEEDDHTIYLKRGDEVLTRWSATGASRASIRDDIPPVECKTQNTNADL